MTAPDARRSRRFGPPGTASDTAALVPAGPPSATNATSLLADVVLGLVPRKRREAYEVRVRSITGGVEPVRSVLVRRGRIAANGQWVPKDDNSMCGLTIAADRFGDVLGLLRAAADVLKAEGLLKP